MKKREEDKEGKREWGGGGVSGGAEGTKWAVKRGCSDIHTNACKFSNAWLQHQLHIK